MPQSKLSCVFTMIYNITRFYIVMLKSAREVLDRLLVKNTRRKFRTCLGLGGVCYAVRDLFVFRGPADDLRHKASAWRGLPEGYRLRENRGWKTPRDSRKEVGEGD